MIRLGFLDKFLTAWIFAAMTLSTSTDYCRDYLW